MSVHYGGEVLYQTKQQYCNRAAQHQAYNAEITAHPSEIVRIFRAKKTGLELSGFLLAPAKGVAA